MEAFHQETTGGSKATSDTTRGALRKAIARAHYQAIVWRQDNILRPQLLPPATTYGWKEEGDRLVPVPTRDPPAPATVTYLINVGARRPVAHHTVPVGRRTSTAPRCVCVEPTRRCAVMSTGHSSELKRMKKKEILPSNYEHKH